MQIEQNALVSSSLSAAAPRVAARLGRAVGAPARAARRTWISAPVLWLDAALRRHQGVFEFTSNPECIFRVSITQLKDDLRLANGVVERGRRVADLHLWNEQLPIPAKDAPPLVWGRQISRALVASLAELTAFLGKRPDLKDVAGAYANIWLGTAEHTDQLVRLSGRFGFEHISEEKPWVLTEQIHRIGMNILLSMIVLSLNTKLSPYRGRLRRRVTVFLPRTTLETRFLRQIQAQMATGLVAEAQ
jgi:hypothetical protein